MLAICRLFVIVTLLASHGLCLPVGEGGLEEISSPSTLSARSIVRRKEKKDPKTKGDRGGGGPDYASFQISDGKAGKSKDAAIKVFLKPYNLELKNFVIGPKDALKKVSQADYQKIKKMAALASDNEKGFNKADPRAQNAVLQRGKIANKVLKIMGHLTYLAIDNANGKPTPDMEKETKKLKKNVGTDEGEKSRGKPMRSFLTKNKTQ